MLLFYQLFLDTQEKQCFIEGLMEEYGRLMLTTARRYVKNEHTAEDIVQDCVVKLILHVDNIMARPRCILPAYIVITVRNTSFNYLKAKALHERRILGVPIDELDEFAAQGESVEQILILADEKRNFSEIWSKLQESDRGLLEKKYLLDETDAEIAADLGCKTDSVRMKLTRARRRAAKLYCEEEMNHDKA